MGSIQEGVAFVSFADFRNSNDLPGTDLMLTNLTGSKGAAVKGSTFFVIYFLVSTKTIKRNAIKTKKKSSLFIFLVLDRKTL
jgi:hypothetical protein